MLGYEINYITEKTPPSRTKITDIFVPFNFTKSAYVGLKYAAGFAKLIGAKVTILHCFQSTALEFGSASDVAYSTATYERKDEILRKVPELKKVNTSFLVEHAFLHERLKELNSQNELSMVIMGSQISGDRQKMFGTNASSLINHLNVPLLIVPDDIKVIRLKNILFAVDYKEFEQLKSMETLETLANISHATVHVVHVCPGDLTPYQIVVEEKLAKILDGVDNKFYQYNYPNVHQGLKDFTKMQSIDLVTMVPRKHGFMESMYKSSETKKMALDTRVPLLVFHD